LFFLKKLPCCTTYATSVAHTQVLSQPNPPHLPESDPSLATDELTVPRVVRPVLAWLARLWRRVENLAFGVVLLLISLYFTLQSAPVQNWLIQKTAAYLSSELQTRVTVGRVDIAFFDHLSLEQVFIADHAGDTLIYAGQLTVGLRDNVFSVLSRRLEFSELTLSNAHVHLRRAEGQYENNLQFLIDYFGGTSTKPKSQKSPFRVRIQNLRLSNVEFLQDDRARGERMRCVVPQLSARINNLDVPSKIADIESVHVQGVRFSLEEFPYVKLAPRTKAPSATPPSNASTTPRIFKYNIHHLHLEDCAVWYDRTRDTSAVRAPEGILDLNHLAVQGIDFEADSIRFDDNLHFAGRVAHFAARERCGLAITHGEAARMVATDTLTSLYGMRIETRHSQLGDTVLLSYNQREEGKLLGYRSFRKFNSRVEMDLRMAQGSRIGLADVAHFHASLDRNLFFQKNKNLVADFSGRISGTVNDLDGQNLAIRVGEGLDIRCKFKLDNIARSAEERRASVTFERLESQIATLRELIPGFRPPANFERLGLVRFEGSYDLFFGTDHVLAGKLKTSIGSGSANMNLKLEKGKMPTYSGALAMSRFELDTWTGNKDFGPTSFRVEIKDGSRGLTLPTIEAKVEGVLDTFSYRNYLYKDIRTNGTFSQSLFDGTLDVKDPNLDFHFDGTVNLRDSVWAYNFSANLAKLDVQRLNLSKQNLVVSAKVDTVRLTGRSVKDLAGFAVLRNLQIIQTTEQERLVHRLDAVRFSSNTTGGIMRRFSLESDVVQANAEGVFDLDKAPKNLLRLLSLHFPEFAQKLRLPAYDSVAVTDVYKFGMYIGNTQSLTKLIDRQLDTLKNISLGGSLNGPAGYSELYLRVPRLRYGTVVADSILVNWQSNGDKANFKLQLPRTRVSNRFKIYSTVFSGDVVRDKVFFGLKTQDTSAIVQSIDLRGILTTPDSVWQVQFNASRFDLFQQQWALEEDNYIRFGPDYIETQNFELFNGDQRITLNGINQGRGLDLSLNSFDIDFMNNIVPARGIKYRGKLSDFGIQIGDVFRMQNTFVYVATDTVFLNNQPYGRIDGRLDWPSLDAPLEWDISAHDDSFNLAVKGAWMLLGKGTGHPNNGIGALQANEMSNEIKGNNFPMSIVQQFVPGISNTDGRFDIEARLGGQVAGSKTALGLNGGAHVRKGQFEINYLKTLYSVENQPVKFTNQRIWVDSARIKDPNGHLAIVNGGLTHDFFRKWQVACKVWSLGNDFLLLRTTKADNPLYYGTGVGKFVATFDGTFLRTNIKIDATAAKGSRLSIPLTSESEVKEANFIKFRPKPNPDGTLPAAPTTTKPPTRFQAGDLKGLSLEMNLTITEPAEIELIFDEQAGDILTGHGVGDISLIINREGEFKMYGRYDVRRGEYLFTLLNFVNKPFAVANGGSIIWAEDPYDAQINISATYDENAPVYNLLSDQLSVTGANEAIVNEASRPTKSRVTMHMTGELFKPTIDFDLSFPNVSPQLRSFTDNKLRLLTSDPNELNRQVFGLIVFGAFLPPDEFAPQTVGEAFSTITQFVGSQLSSYLTGIAAEWFGGTVSSIDFDIGYNQYSNTVGLGNGNLTDSGRELQVRMTSGFINDRITINIGTQFGTVQNPAAQFNSSGFLGEDVVIEIQPLENSQWRVKAYQRTEPDITGGSNFRSRYGVGLSFRKDFDNFDDLMKGVGGWFKSGRK
jgi:hypothetical protein